MAQPRSVTIGVSGVSGGAGVNTVIAANVFNPYIDGYITKMYATHQDLGGHAIANTFTIALGSAGGVVFLEFVRSHSQNFIATVTTPIRTTQLNMQYDAMGSYGIRIESGNTSVIVNDSANAGAPYNIEFVITPP